MRIIFLTALMCTLSITAIAQDCSVIATDSDRLACYDAAARAPASTLATKSAAQDKNQKKHGEVLGYIDVRELTSAGKLTFPGLGSSNYSENGNYSFTDEAKSITRFGVFDIRKDGRVCVDFFQIEKRRCDIFLRRNGLVFVLIEEGDRFPVFFTLE